MNPSSRNAHRSEASFLLKRCSVCSQCFPDQAALDQHTQSDHPTDASGFLYIPVERFRSERLPNGSEPVRSNFGFSTRIPNTGREGSKREIAVRRDSTSGRSTSLCSADSCDTRDRRGRCRYSNHHASQTLLHSGQSFVLSGNADTTHNRGTPAITGQYAFTQAPQSSSTRSNVDVAGDRRPSVLPGTPAQIQQLFCSKCIQSFTEKAAFDRHLLVCSILCEPPTNRSSPLLYTFRCTQCDFSFPSMVGLRSHSNKSHGNPTLAAPPITSRYTNPTPAPLTRCEPCKQDFPTPNALKLHLLNSSLHAPKHRCNVCTLQFATHAALVVHGVLDHGLELPCDQCDSWFATEELREMHVGSAHKKIEIQSAQQSLNWTTSSNVGIRASIFKNAIYQCSHCQETFRKPKKLDKHLQLCSKPQTRA